MDFELSFQNGGCLEGRAISNGNELYEDGSGLCQDAIVGDILVPLLKRSEEDQEELPVRTRCVMPTSVREYRKEKGKEKVIAYGEKRPPCLVEGFEHWQDGEPLCHDICVSTFPIA